MNGLKKAAIEPGPQGAGRLAVFDKPAFARAAEPGPKASLGSVSAAQPVEERRPSGLLFFSGCPTWAKSPMERSRCHRAFRQATGARGTTGRANSPRDDGARSNSAKARYLGKSGRLTEILKALGKLEPEQRREVGGRDQRRQGTHRVRARPPGERARAERCSRRGSARRRIDVTLPGRGGRAGRHCIRFPGPRARRGDLPLDRLRRRRRPRDRDRLAQLHRAEHAGEPPGALDARHLLRRRTTTTLLLRTHTSPMQIRYARMHKPPIKVIAPGRPTASTPTPRTRRCSTRSRACGSARHQLRRPQGRLHRLPAPFLRDRRLQVRFRPSFFPFTEPSAEIDMRFDGPLKGRWLEISGSGRCTRTSCATSGSTRSATSASRSARGSSA
jgi:phenylalanyl-tRNA synthetase alpha chain